MSEYLRSRVLLVIVALIYIPFVICGYVATTQRMKSVGAVEYVATRILRPNHRIAEEDIAAPDGLPGSLWSRLPDKNKLIGRYVSNEIGNGRHVEARNLTIAPAIHIGKEMATLAVAIDEELVDAQSSVELASSVGDCVEARTTVLAVMGRDKNRYAIVAIPANRLTTLAGANCSGKIQARLVLP